MSQSSRRGMDSQADSIDIAKLQRVALGLEHEPSHPALTKIRAIGETSQDNPPKPDHADQAISRASVSPAPQRQYPTPSNPPRSQSRSPSRSSQPNDTTQSPPGFEDDNCGSVSQPGKMSSADAAPSDTQVVSQSVFDSIIRQNKESTAAEGLENSGDGGTLRTLHEGETGHIDLLSGFENTHPDATHIEENDDQSSSKLGESSPTHYEPNLFPESQRFLTTPAAGTTQTRPDAPSTETPRGSRNPLTADTESSGGVMALSQVFKATQVPSSPLVNNGPPQADPLSDRPSPSAPLQSHAPLGALSSPFMSLPTKLQGRRSSEQQYIPMDESQAKRDRLLGQRMTRSVELISPEDQSSGEFNTEPSFVRRLRRQREIEEEANAQFVSFAAPARPLSSRSSNKEDKLRSSPHRKPEEAQQGGSGGPVLESEPHGSDAVHQNGATSEEETEQEEDLDGPVHPPQEPHESTEEDKENYNDLPALNCSAAANSHDRLSQALGLSHSQSQHDRSSAQEPVDSRYPRSSNRDEQVDMSSQVYVVKDSQQSPSRKEKGSREGSIPNQPQNEGTPENTSSRIEPDAFPDVEKVPSSPIMRPPPRSSPPSEHQRGPSPSLPPAENTDTRDQSVVETSHESSNKSREKTSSHNSQPHTSNPASQKRTDANGNLPEKSSSALSQIAETPLEQHPDSSRDMTTATSIPETSPNRFQGQNWTGEENGETQQEDDDLPPMYSVDHERAGQHGESDAQRSMLAARRMDNPKMLSSPSGRPRRTLTEIASDVSPQVGHGHYDMDFGLLTAEDKEFNIMVSASPVPPRKKRRRNIARDFYASDSVLPVAPQAPDPQLVNGQQDEAVEKQPEPSESASATAKSFFTQSSPPQRADTAPEVDALRKSVVRRVGRPPKSASRRRGRPPGIRRPAKDGFAGKVVEAVVIYNRPSNGPSSDAAPVPSHAGQPMDTSADPMYSETKPPFTDGAQIVQNQVLAPWSGQTRAYYVGTCYGMPAGPSSSRYLVKFEDSAPVEVSMSAVKRMELRVGDAVKVDMPGFPKITHIIRGFADKLSEEELGKQAADGLIPLTDVHGHSKVVLGPKQRKSLPGGGLVEPESEVTIPISNIYLDTILWNQLKDRDFTFNCESAQSETRRRTPSEQHSTPTSPSSRIHRTIHASTGLFSGMAFAVSYTNEDAKARITRLIVENGGLILKDGFNELFAYTSSVPLATLSESDPNAAENSEPFRLTGAAEEIGFACLIADKHSRREKYMQALALNLPCLSGRWIEDCAAQRHVVDWGMYLLPAGESLYLDGAAKSRLLPPTPPATARLADTVADRPNLLAGQSVLLVMGRGKAEEKRKAYIFLTYALGASKMQRVLDLKSAKAVLDQQAGWDWVFVDDDEQDSARAMILGESTDVPVKSQSARRGRKRKMPAGPVDPSSGGGAKARVVGNEFLCQSLILGRLFE
ncbi:hypothetical protein PHISP_07690 [Aspergillus sp. HF37]|nr:hypothetical protein PHISP_07690 [Aspergillus sp. HF37]